MKINSTSSKKKSNENIKANIDLSKCEELERKDDLVIYKYPINDIEKINVTNPNKESNEKEIPLIFKYHCDDFDMNDEKLAYVILFVGKTGHGKSTAINAFFNIIKGIKLEDKYRIILIKEEKQKGGQAVFQTDGIHLYYIKDYNNHPLIIIDSQGYGDIRGMYKDLEIDEAFKVVFSEIIDHINAVGFILNATVNRLDINTKYIFTSITALFAGDINENFIILATHANYESMTDPFKYKVELTEYSHEVNQLGWVVGIINNGKMPSLVTITNDFDVTIEYSIDGVAYTSTFEPGTHALNAIVMLPHGRTTFSIHGVEGATGNITISFREGYL